MRLDNLDTGHRRPAKFFLLMASKASGAEMADVVKTFLYRPEFFGRAISQLSARAMRGPSSWTAGEREYIALSTAKVFRIPYCVEIHTEMVRLASGGEIDAADPASVRPELEAVLAFLEKVEKSPDSVSAADIVQLREQGVSDDAVIEALHVAFVWNVVDRLAHAFDYELLEGQLKKGTRALHMFKYQLPGFVLH